MYKTAISVLALTFALVNLSGCDKDRDEKSEKPEKHEKEAKHDSHAEARTAEKYGKSKESKEPNVAGKWVGVWASTKNKEHGGGLSCEAVEKARNEWEAVFTAEYGKIGKYNVNLKGRPENGKVVFGGTVNLGEKGGGLFTWSGRATETEFTGEYEGGGDTGTFKMTRADKKSSLELRTGRPVPARNDDDSYLSPEAKRDFVE